MSSIDFQEDAWGRRWCHAPRRHRASFGSAGNGQTYWQRFIGCLKQGIAKRPARTEDVALLVRLKPAILRDIVQLDLQPAPNGTEACVAMDEFGRRMI